MMLISSSCIGARIYKSFAKVEFNNPFIWACLDFNSIKNLIVNWDRLNFDNIELVKNNDHYVIIVDKLVAIDYIHYKQDDSLSNTKVTEVNVYSNNIKEYVIESYHRRVARMKQCNEKPIFILASGWRGAPYHIDENRLNELCKIKTEYDIIVSADKNFNFNLVKHIPQNIKIVKHELPLSKSGTDVKIAEMIYNRFLKF